MYEIQKSSYGYCNYIPTLPVFLKSFISLFARVRRLYILERQKQRANVLVIFFHITFIIWSTKKNFFVFLFWNFIFFSLIFFFSSFLVVCDVQRSHHIKVLKIGQSMKVARRLCVMVFCYYYCSLYTISLKFNSQ